MSIKHFHELPASSILEFCTAETATMSIKFDGSYIRVGVDENGQYYSQWKKDRRFYDVSEYPDKPWANFFRLTHRIMEAFFINPQSVEELSPGIWIDLEIINGARPNVILYDAKKFRDIRLIVTGTSSEKFVQRVVFNQQAFSVIGSITDFVRSTEDGVSLETVRKYYSWSIFRKSETGLMPTSTKQFYLISGYLRREIIFHGWVTTREQILNVNLSKDKILLFDKSNYILEKQEVKKIITSARNQIRRTIKSHAISLIALTQPTHDDGDVSRCEGIVINRAGNLTKVIYGDHFGKANRFVHFVKYALSGGRRPERPSFISRTQHWPEADRLARLDVLLERFKANFKRLKFAKHGYDISFEEKDLYDKALLTFAETRERVIHGRRCV